MVRPTDLLRQLLIQELWQEHVTARGRALRKQLKEADIVIIDRIDRPMDVWIQYRFHHRIYESVYMRAMLEAEVTAKAGGHYRE